jgi:hypothetical protein
MEGLKPMIARSVFIALGAFFILTPFSYAGTSGQSANTPPLNQFDTIRQAAIPMIERMLNGEGGNFVRPDGTDLFFDVYEANSYQIKDVVKGGDTGTKYFVTVEFTVSKHWEYNEDRHYYSVTVINPPDTMREDYCFFQDLSQPKGFQVTPCQTSFTPYAHPGYAACFASGHEDECPLNQPRGPSSIKPKGNAKTKSLGLRSR